MSAALISVLNERLEKLEEPVRIRLHPELQHTLSHLILAVDALLAGQEQLAAHHSEIAKLAVLFESDEAAEAELDGKTRRESQLHQPEQGQAQETDETEAEEGQRQEIVIGCTKCDRPWSEHTGDPRTGAECPRPQATFKMDLLVSDCVRCGGNLMGLEHRWEVANDVPGQQIVVTVHCEKERRA